MSSTITAVFLILFFSLLIGIVVVAFFVLQKTGLLASFMKGKWLLSLLSFGFIIAFIAGGIGLLARSEWAVPLLRYTIYGWLAYLWLYGLGKLVGMWTLLRQEEATTISQFAGRDPFFDEVLEKSIEFGKRSIHPEPESDEMPHAITDSPMEEMMNDEELFEELFPFAIRRKMKRKMIGLLIHTAIMLLILWGL